jgi:glycosyltransferase involved in cell wall biosynthesis
MMMWSVESAYIFADPVGRPDNGVTSYVRNAAYLLGEEGIHPRVVARRPRESMRAYRRRLAAYVGEIRKARRQVLVEAPESDAVTAEIPLSTAEIHIRLHCSRQLGAFVQGQKVCKKSLELEQREILRAARISSPSRSAVIASRMLFDMPENICCYPNPAPAWPAEIRPSVPDKRAHVLFVGRFHTLKGAHWVLNLVRRLPDIPFLIIGPDPGKTRFQPLPLNLGFADGTAWNKVEHYRLARLVIIPSLYETASMVGIEALAAGVPVVAWSHLGIAEYGSAPAISLIEPYHLDVFAETVRRLFRAPGKRLLPIGAASNLNDLYLKGFHAALDGSQGDYMPVALTGKAAVLIPQTLRKSIEISMPLLNTEPRWRRKLRKLQRDPIRYFKDSWIWRAVIAPKVDFDIEPRASNASGVTAASKIEIAKLSPLPPKAEAAASKPSAPKLQKSKPFVFINGSDRIEFKEPPAKPKGFIIAFLSPESRQDDAQGIIKTLSVFDDFRYVSHPHLQVGTFQDHEGGSAIDLIERIDLKNKRLISAVDHIILLNPPPVIVQGLRSCGTRQRTIVILDGKDSIPPDPWHTDALIVIGEEHPAASTQNWRRKIVVRERAHLPLAIRRAIQEGGPKTPDMPLPLLGFDGDYRLELLRLDVRYYQGIIRMAQDRVPSGRTMKEIYAHLATEMTGLAVTESVYLRYRSLCDGMQDLEVRKQFLSYSLYDGVIFDVRA